MTTITIPKKITKGEELIAVPREEYEAFVRFHLKEDKGLELTAVQRKRLKKSRENLAKNAYFTLYELKQKLGIKN